MKNIILAILSVFVSIFSYSQTQDTSLTIKNIKELFKTDFNYVCCVGSEPEWSACFSNSDNYESADTILLYSDKYHYLKDHCCYTIDWVFKGKTTITIAKTNVCQDPPIGSVSLNDSNLKIKFKKSEDKLILLLYKDNRLRDTFVLRELTTDLMHNGKNGYRLTMVRQKRETTTNKA